MKSLFLLVFLIYGTQSFADSPLDRIIHRKMVLIKSAQESKCKLSLEDAFWTTDEPFTAFDIIEIVKRPNFNIRNPKGVAFNLIQSDDLKEDYDENFHHSEITPYELSEYDRRRLAEYIESQNCD